MSNATYGLYSDPESAQRAVDALRSAGVNEPAITVISSEPFEEHEFGRRDHHTLMPWLAALGGLTGGAAGYLLVSLTQLAYPLPTAGMPIVTLWSNGIITYELAMLGAILTTLATLLLAARLPNWKPQLYDPAVSDGKILIGAANQQGASRIELAKILRESGAIEVKDFMVSLKSKAQKRGDN
jgi:hypothetical protein